jgi:hypothetical protein
MIPDDPTSADIRQTEGTASESTLDTRGDRIARGGAGAAAGGGDFRQSRIPLDSTGDGGVMNSRSTDPALPSIDSSIRDGWVIETIVSPFQCLYQDALAFHTQSRLARSESDSSRLARAALLLYISSAESLAHQAAEELGRPELRAVLADPGRPLPLLEIFRLLPASVGQNGVPTRPLDPQAPPWPQFAELVMLRNAWAYPGPASSRRAYYRSTRRDGSYEPLEVHQVPPDLARAAGAADLAYPRTGLPRDPYALRPRHLDTARGVLDAAVAALDSCLGGALTRGQRHRREPVRVVHPPSG